MGRKTFNFDWLIFIPALLLTSLGLVTLLSIDPKLFYQQLLFAILGLVAFWFFTHIDFEIYKYLDKFIYVGSILFLMITFLGPNIRGSTRWLEIGIFRLQPSELMKPFILLALASFMIRYPPVNLRYIFYHVLLLSLPAALIFSQPDLGNTLVYTSMWVSLLVISGIPTLFLFVGVLGFATGLPIVFRFLRDYQRLRIITFLNPLIDPQGAGYNAIQSMIAVGAGRVFGRGFGRGTQSILNFLPERHTDFIFATMSEEFGFLGGFVLLTIFFILLWQILSKSQKIANRQMAFLFGTGFFALIFTHLAINVGMNLGLVPITGITLPFVSYGGSSMLSTWIGLGIFASILQKTLPIDSK